MIEMEKWDWATGEKCISDVVAWRRRFPIVHEFDVSCIGEKIAAIVEIGNKQVTPCINAYHIIYSNIYSNIILNML